MTVDQTLPLRERKKLRTRRALTETALAMFAERGFEATTLDALVDAVEVSKRTFFRHFRSKEDVALTAVKKLWATFLDILAERAIDGPLFDGLRDVLIEAIERMDDDWFRQFEATLRLIESSPALNGYSLRHCAEVRDEVVARLGRGDPLEIRLLVEITIATWRCAHAEWRGRSGRAELATLVHRAFAAAPRSLALE